MPKSIMIVDDNEMIRNNLRALFSRNGDWNVCAEATDGKQGLELLKKGPAFDLALIDWNMPVMNGLDMLTHLRSQGFSGMKVMMVTTEAENDFILRALDSGADEYLMKPFDEEALNDKLALLGLAEN